MGLGFGVEGSRFRVVGCELRASVLRSWAPK